MIIYEEAFDHHLFTVPLSLFNVNQEKKKLARILMSKSNEEYTNASKVNTTYVIDLMALMRVVMAIPENF